MKIFPAIDIKDKKCVRLIKGDFDNKTEYKMSPIEQAGIYKEHGFKNLHVVDLDGALTGEIVNLDIIHKIVSKFDLKIEIGHELHHCTARGIIKRVIKASLLPKSGRIEILPTTFSLANKASIPPTSGRFTK